MVKKLFIILVIFICMLPVSTVSIKAESGIIENDETGIPDRKLYKKILNALKKKSDEKITGKEAESIERLWLGWGNEIVTFKGLGYLKNLEKLDCWGINTKDLEEIASQLPQLKRLNIQGYDEVWETSYPPIEERKQELDSLEPLRNMKHLIVLNVSDNKLKSLDGIEGMTKLKVLRADKNQITNAGAVKELKKLTKIYLSDNQLADLNGINNLTNLKYLDVSNNRLIDVKGIGKLKKLEDLSLSGNSLTNVKGIEKLKKLKVLPVRDNKLKSIGSIKKMKNLVQLDIAGNRLANIKGIKSLKNLKVLNLDKNDLKKADEVVNLKKLEKLSLYGNKLGKLPDLKKMKKLKTLDARDNKLKKIPDLRELKETDIRLEWNYLTKKEIKKKLPYNRREYNQLMKKQKTNIKITYLSPGQKSEITKNTTEIVGRITPTVIEECIPQVYLCLSNGELIGWDGSMHTITEADKDGIFRLEGLDLTGYAGQEIRLVLAIDYDIYRFTIDRFVVQD